MGVRLPQGLPTQSGTMYENQELVAARANVLKQLKENLLTPTEAKYRLMGLGMEETVAIEKVAGVLNARNPLP